MSKTDDPNESFASPPCSMHELDTAWVTAADQASDVKRWRKAERNRLIEARLALPLPVRRQHDERMVDYLLPHLDMAGSTVALYWPIRGEPDLRSLFDTLASRGIRCALPVLVADNSPLAFRSWSPGQPLVRGVWNILSPDESADTVVPDILVAPMVGFDRARFRLGYGGGYYDRTLAAMPHKPKTIGIGYSLAGLQTIFPQPHDVPMDIVVTENGAFVGAGDPTGMPPA